jgi:hypothetical protein
MDEASLELTKVLMEEEVANACLLVLANKQARNILGGVALVCFAC